MRFHCASELHLLLATAEAVAELAQLAQLRMRRVSEPFLVCLVLPSRRLTQLLFFLLSLLVVIARVFAGLLSLEILAFLLLLRLHGVELR